MLLVDPITHIRREERGVSWIADANTKVIEVAMDQAAYGWDAGEIHAAHPPIIPLRRIPLKWRGH